MNGTELKRLREQLGLSAPEAARQVEVSVRTWWRYEASESVPKIAAKLFQIENGLVPPGAGKVTG